jgi:hypothetical protein
VKVHVQVQATTTTTIVASLWFVVVLAVQVRSGSLVGSVLLASISGFIHRKGETGDVAPHTTHPTVGLEIKLAFPPPRESA